MYVISVLDLVCWPIGTNFQLNVFNLLLLGL